MIGKLRNKMTLIHLKQLLFPFFYTEKIKFPKIKQAVQILNSPLIFPYLNLSHNKKVKD